MSRLGKPSISELGLNSLGDRLAESLSCEEEANKPDFRELNLGSPVSPLRIRGMAAAATSSSSSSSGSVSGTRTVQRRSDSGQAGTNSHSGELSGSSESSPTASESLRSRNFMPGHSRSDSGSSPAPGVLPAGNICPSGKILKPGIAGRAHRSDVLGSGTGNYGHGSIMRGGIAPAAAARCEPAAAAVGNQRAGADPEEVKRAGNEQYKRGNFAEALGLYDRAIALSPGNAAYRSNRAAALTGLRRVWEAVKECQEAVKLDPNYGRAHRRLASLFLRLVLSGIKKDCFLDRDLAYIESSSLCCGLFRTFVNSFPWIG